MSNDASTPDAWSLSAQAVETGVRLDFIMPIYGLEGAIQITREEARAFARCLLAAAGDALERTFPHPPIQGTNRG